MAGALLIMIALLAQKGQLGKLQNSSLNTSGMVTVSPPGSLMTWREPVANACNKQTCSDEDGDITCPPGLFCEAGYCECGNSYPRSLITCNGTNSFILRRFCATFSSITNSTSVGLCFHFIGEEERRELYSELPGNASAIEGILCEPIHRTGNLCGDCMPGYYPSAYSYSIKCTNNCTKPYLNWITYVTVAFFPLTLFYIFVLFFKINTTSSPLFATARPSQTLLL